MIDSPYSACSIASSSVQAYIFFSNPPPPLYAYQPPIMSSVSGVPRNQTNFLRVRDTRVNFAPARRKQYRRFSLTSPGCIVLSRQRRNSCTTRKSPLTSSLLSSVVNRTRVICCLLRIRKTSWCEKPVVHKLWYRGTLAIVQRYRV